MKRVITVAAVAALGAGAAHAGGVERSTQSVGILFEKGNYAEISFGAFNPDVSGSFPITGAKSGDMAPGYGTYSLGVKQALSNKIDMAIILDQPIGANVHYASGTGYPIAGSTAEINASAVTGLLRYKFDNNISVYGGLRIETASGKVSLPFLGYSMSTSTETDAGYIVGVAWEKPEIAARVALTYNSKITHNFNSTESSGTFGVLNSTFSTTVPESVNLEFQTGVAKDTLVMGSIRWVHWKQFDITPTMYSSAPPAGYGQGALVDYANNVTTFNIGVGRKFNEQWSGAVILGYEKHEGGVVGNLGPTDGYKSISVAASYQATDNIKVTGGLRYVDIGDAKTNIGGVNTSFKGNKGWGAGLKVGITF